MTSPCVLCGSAIAEGTRRDSMYCSARCRTAAWRQRATATTPAIETQNTTDPTTTPTGAPRPSYVAEADTTDRAETAQKESPTVPINLHDPDWREDPAFVELDRKRLAFEREARQLREALPALDAANQLRAAELDAAEGDDLAGLGNRRTLDAARQAMASSAVKLTEAQERLRVVTAAAARVADAGSAIADRAKLEVRKQLRDRYRAALGELGDALIVASEKAEAAYRIHAAAEDQFEWGGTTSPRGMRHPSAAGLIRHPWCGDLGRGESPMLQGAQSRLDFFLNELKTDALLGDPPPATVPSPQPPTTPAAPAPHRRFTEGWLGR